MGGGANGGNPGIALGQGGNGYAEGEVGSGNGNWVGIGGREIEGSGATVGESAGAEDWGRGDGGGLAGEVANGATDVGVSGTEGATTDAVDVGGATGASAGSGGEGSASPQ